MNISHIPNTRPPRQRQRGFSLWELAVLLGLLGVMVVAGFKLLNSMQASRLEEQRTALLAAADRAVLGFIADNGRLPCVDVDGDGVEDCGSMTQKGWLPTATLSLKVSAPQRGEPKLRYVAYRTAGLDLASNSDLFNPSKWDGSRYAFGSTNVVDFCAGLGAADKLASTTPSAAAAHIKASSGSAISNIAYAIADGGEDRDNDGVSFDGLNVSSTVGLESPARATDTGYDDHVLAHDFLNLGVTLDCAQATRSLDAMAAAVDVVNEVKSQKDWALASAIIMTAISAVKTVISGVKLTIAVMALATAITNIGVISAVLAADVASCIVLVGCALIPIDTAALNFAIAAAVAAGIAVGLNTGALAANAAAAVLYGIIAGKAGAAVAAGGGSLADLLPQLLTAVNDAQAKDVAAAADAIAARAAANAAYSTYTNSVNALYNLSRSYDSTPATYESDPKLAAMLAAYQAYQTAQAAYDTAQGNADAKHKYVADLNAAVPTAQANYNQAQATFLATPASDPKYPVNQVLAQSALDTLNNINAEIITATNAASALDAIALQKKTDRDNALTNYQATQAFIGSDYPTSLAGWDVLCRADQNFYNTYSGVLSLFGVCYPSSIPQTDAAWSDYVHKKQDADNKEFIAATAHQNYLDALQQYNDLYAALNAPPGSGSGTLINVYTGAEAILQAADLKGAMQ